VPRRRSTRSTSRSTSGPTERSSSWPEHGSARRTGRGARRHAVLASRCRVSSPRRSSGVFRRPVVGSLTFRRDPVLRSGGGLSRAPRRGQGAYTQPPRIVPAPIVGPRRVCPVVNDQHRWACHQFPNDEWSFATPG
jgi:hypothetical protein